MGRIIFYLSLVFIYLLTQAIPVFACDSCGCTLARVSNRGKLSAKDQPFFFDFTFEQQIWHERSAASAHALHHQGHHVHNKTHEEFYHFSLGANPTERLSLLAELPYVVRHSIEVDNHRFLGVRQRSEGFGDLRLTGIFKLLEREYDFLGPVVGIKMPTGGTTERNKQGGKFEPELQPGSGSWDPIMGGAFRYGKGRVQFSGNALYTIRTRGAQEFRYGNLFSSYLYADYLMNAESKYFNSKIGIVTHLQHEAKQHDRDGVIADSGGTTWLLGPEFSVQGNKYVSLFANILFPIYQDLGGVHQLVQYVWNAGIKIAF